jgi:glycosyltransferase involved in cell wall biosynthesis
LQECIWLPGRLSNDELPARLNDADIYLACSRSDGSSISLLEAMASGLPAIVSNIEGNAEWVCPGEGGNLACVDEPQQFAREIVMLAADEGARATAGRRNREVASARADWSRNVGALRIAIEAMVGRGGVDA